MVLTAALPFAAHAQTAISGPGEIVADMEGDGEEVVLDGRLSVAFGGATITSYTWFELVPGGQLVQLGTGPVYTHFFDPGVHEVVLEVAGTGPLGPQTSQWTQTVYVSDPILVPTEAPDLASAVAASVSGDAIVLERGIGAPAVYSGFGFIDVPIGHDLLVRGEGNDPEQVVIDLGNNGRALRIEPGSVLTVVEGITFRNGNVAGGGPFFGQGGAVLVSGTARIRRCRFLDNQADDGGAVCGLEGQVRLSSCTFEGNSAARGAAVAHDGTFLTRVYNCTMAGNSGLGTVATIQGPFTIAGTMNVFNSILWDNAGAVEVLEAIPGGGPGGVSVLQSIVDGGWPGVGNLNLDPQFVNAAQGDLRLRPSSPGVDGAQGDLARHPGGADLNGLAIYDTPSVPGAGGLVPNADLGAREYLPLSATQVVVEPAIVTMLSEQVQLASEVEFMGVAVPWAVLQGWVAANPAASVMTTGLYTAPAQQLSMLDVTATYAAAGAGSVSGTGTLTPHFLRGDVNLDQAVNIADATFLLSTLFPNGTGPTIRPLEDSSDANDDGAINIADAITILSFLFPPQGIPPVVIPEPTMVPGPDPTPDPLP